MTLFGLFACKGCLAYRESLLSERSATAAERERTAARETELLAQLKDLTDKFTALADLRAQALIAQAAQGPPQIQGRDGRGIVRRPPFIPTLSHDHMREATARTGEETYRRFTRAAGVAEAEPAGG